MSSPNLLRGLKRIVSPKVSPKRSPNPGVSRQLFKKCENPKETRQFYQCGLKLQKNICPPLIHINEFQIPDIGDQLEKLSNLNLEKCHVLGKGSFCTVVLANYKGSLVAAKLVSKNNPKSINLISRERNILNMCHPNIVSIYKILEGHPDYHIVLTELSDPTTLQNVIDEKQFNLSNDQKLRFIIDVCKGLEFCHGKGILHLDIKPKNILVNLSSNLSKICDFGNSLKLQNLSNENEWKIQGTIKYMAPELLKGERPSEKCDIYSLGITIWQTVHEEMPYQDLKNETLIYLVIAKECRPTSRASLMFEEYNKCWATKPDDRPSIKEILHSLNSKAKREKLI